jgi:cyclic GMP-AMP synthase DncV-like protein
MANTNTQFLEYNDNLKIPKSKRDIMIESRTAATERLKKWFEKNQPEYPISFWIQGSHKNNLNIRTEDEDCDQDDGLYVDRDPEDSVSGTTLQNYVVKALTGSTITSPSHKAKCVRNYYQASGLGPYHIDYPAYYKTDDMDHPMLAVKNSNLEKSDPKEFTGWLNDQVDDQGQLKRLIRYMKGWADNISKMHKMPNGLILTVLSCNNYISRSGRDDEALYDTLTGIYNGLDANWECIMPAIPNDNLLERYDETFQSNFMNALNNLINDARSALEEASKHEATKLWKKHMGKRYPLVQKEAAVGNRAALAGLVGNNKPYNSGKTGIS